MGVARAYKAPAAYNGSELSELDYDQTADTLYMAHWDHAPAKLTRADHTDWTYSDVAFSPAIAAPATCSATATTPNVDAANSGDGYFPQPATYCVTAVNDVTGEESRASPSDTATNDLTLKRNYNSISWAAVTDATRYNIYKADNDQFFGYIGTTESLAFRDDNIGPALDKAPPLAQNPFAAAGDYPSTVKLFEQRSMWARTRNAPNAVTASRTGFPENMDRSRPLQADDSMSFAIVAGQVNSINHLVTTTSLLALTADSIFAIDGDGGGGVLKANSNPDAKREVGRGSSRVRPAVVDNVVFYVQATGTGFRTINYSFEIDGLKSNDVSIYSPHLFNGYTVVDMAYAQEPRSILWVVRSDGTLLAFTWEQEQNVWGWTVVETSGLVKSICTILEDGEHRLYLLVERTVGSLTKRFVERMVPQLWSDPKTAVFVDCGVQGTLPKSATEVSGLWHLAGRSDVAANIDGAFLTDLTVDADGVLALTEDMLPVDDGEDMTVTVGLSYAVDVHSLPLRSDTKVAGSNLGRRQQPGDVVLQLSNTAAISAGIDEDHLFPVKQRLIEAFGDPSALFDGVTLPLSMANKAGTDICAHIRQTVPGPFTLLAIAVDPIING